MALRVDSSIYLLLVRTATVSRPWQMEAVAFHYRFEYSHYSLLYACYNLQAAD